MEPKNTPNSYTVRYTLRKDQIQGFLDSLELMRYDYLEDAVEASGYKDATIVIQHVMELK